MLRDLDVDNINIVGSYPYNKDSYIDVEAEEIKHYFNQESDIIVYRSQGNHDRNNGIFTKDIGKSDNSYYDQYPYTIEKF